MLNKDLVDRRTRTTGGLRNVGAMRTAAEALVEWCDAHPASYPPTLIHVTDGESRDGDPSTVANALKQISTSDGECLLFNLHISTSGGQPVVFPSSEAGLDEYGRLLFLMSSAFPNHLIQIARDKGYKTVSSESRFFGYKAGYEVIVDFFDIGTRASNLR
jgi:hypothetical protein